MATKNNPGDYDCYAKLEDDEPYFLLRGKDPATPFLTAAWVASRRGDWAGMTDIFLAMSLNEDVLARVSTDEYEKLAEARKVINDMNDWRKTRQVSSDK